MAQFSSEKEVGLTKELRKRIARISFERMEQECESGFHLLRGFRTLGVRRFSEWISGLERPLQLEAALSVTCRQLQLRHIECNPTPNFERWVRSYGAFPLNAGLDMMWQPRRYASAVARTVRNGLAPTRQLGPRSLELAEDNPLAFPVLRTGIELNTKNADIVLFQFVRGDLGLLDLSYVSLLGLGQTGWCVHSEDEIEDVVKHVPEFIAKVGEIVSGR